MNRKKILFCLMSLVFFVSGCGKATDTTSSSPSSSTTSSVDRTNLSLVADKKAIADSTPSQPSAPLSTHQFKTLSGEQITYDSRLWTKVSGFESNWDTVSSIRYVQYFEPTVNLDRNTYEGYYKVYSDEGRTVLLQSEYYKSVHATNPYDFDNYVQYGKKYDANGTLVYSYRTRHLNDGTLRLMIHDYETASYYGVCTYNSNLGQTTDSTIYLGGRGACYARIDASLFTEIGNYIEADVLFTIPNQGTIYKYLSHVAVPIKDNSITQISSELYRYPKLQGDLPVARMFLSKDGAMRIYMYKSDQTLESTPLVSHAIN